MAYHEILLKFDGVSWNLTKTSGYIVKSYIREEKAYQIQFQSNLRNVD